MQSAETVLGVLRERGRRGLPCDELYRQLFNPQLYLLAYGRIYSNHGAMTPGTSGETVDGMSLGKIERIIDALRHERYRFSPTRRIYIPKKNGKRRPLGLPSWSDKLVGEAVRLLLEAYYEPTFSDRSHGFRPGRGCHTALRDVANTWTGTTWFIEGDVSDCFGSFDHQIMLSRLAEKIQDNRFLRLMRNMLKAGYLEDWVWNATLSGVPQGGVVSPVMSNIYLHRLDEFVETLLIPEYTRGRIRKQDTEYARVRAARDRAHKRGDRVTARELRKQLRGMPSGDPRDPGFRRLHYVRYADDTLFGFAGPKAEAEEIKQRLTTFLHDDLKLELSSEKTLITHARTGSAKFLGYEITVLHNDRKVTRGRRSANGVVSLRVPESVIKTKKAPYLSRGKPERRPHLINEDDHTIVNTYGAEWRGIVQYYLLAGNVHRLYRLLWVMETSLLKTLANKHRSSVSTMARKCAATVNTPHGLRKCFEARFERSGRKPLVARFGGIPLRRQKDTAISDRVLVPGVVRHKELVTRLLADRCELCKGTDGISVHHVRQLADLDRPGQPQPEWAQLMARRRRKTLVVCRECHNAIHSGQPAPRLTQ
ncbi:group II intron reverse transcriptase/maturase [Saccharopolyspora shandongensis]|uniref:Group II intron reverse transcriptase/maturase n=1 Tax=Saccharopolyspora shandongensis TaxID=418495 RepID=A0A1H3G3J2_9PSEU|nr:reverse transcriptase/maturase family protein [Saccharopolyspora shandongensis]SDX97655.1 group II intron reverse transcriptase/maturase [Saccharopolyspora shandongensis]